MSRDKLKHQVNEQFLSHDITFRVNMLKRTSLSYVQNMIENMILTSYSDKPYLVASWGRHVARTQIMSHGKLKHQISKQFLWRDFYVALEGTFPGRGGALPYKPIRDVPFFRISFFSINSWTGMKIDQKFRNRLWLCSRTILCILPTVLKFFVI